MNRKAERVGRSLVEKARTMMIAYNLPERLWPFVIETVAVVLNLLPTKSNPKMESPHERFCKGIGMQEEATKPYIRHLRTYYCHAYYYIKPEKRDKSDKFSPRAKKGYLIRYRDLYRRIFWI